MLQQILKHAFLRRLPSRLAETLNYHAERLTFRELYAEATRRWQARNGRKAAAKARVTVAAAATADTGDEKATPVDALQQERRREKMPRQGCSKVPAQPPRRGRPYRSADTE